MFLKTMTLLEMFLGLFFKKALFNLLVKFCKIFFETLFKKHVYLKRVCLIIPSWNKKLKLIAMEIKKKSTKYLFPANELNKIGAVYEETFYLHS